MSLPSFKTQINQIRKEALELGFAISTMDDYQRIWNKFILWKKEFDFIYNEEDYSRFLLDYYQFDVTTYTNKSKSHYQRLMRSKRILDDFDSYKIFMQKRMLPNALYCEYPSNWNSILDAYLNYCKDVRNNSKTSIKVKRYYLIRLLSYFHQKQIVHLNELTQEHIILFINETIECGNISKRRNFYVLKEFLNYLFIEDILNTDYSIYIPKIKNSKRKKIPTYLKQEEVEKLLENIPRIRKEDIRSYTIILIAARLGLRISDILNIKLKDIEWKHYKLNVLQPKTNHLNVLPLTKEVGWAIIDYIKKARPKTTNEYLFVKMTYPYEKMEKFQGFNKYFEKADIKVKDNNKKGIHNLRHSFATNLLENETPIETIASTLGDTIETTSKTYLRVNKKLLKECSLEVSK